MQSGVCCGPTMLQEIVNLMKLQYSDILSAVLMDEMTSVWFRVDRGMHQGCRMAPDLFLQSMDKMLEDTVTQGYLSVNIGTELFTDLDYANDVALLAELRGDAIVLKSTGPKPRSSQSVFMAQSLIMSRWRATKWSSSIDFAILAPM